MAKFEKVSRFADVDIKMPVRKTKDSAGYDMVVAEDIILDSFFDQLDEMQIALDMSDMQGPQSLDDVAAMTKHLQTKPTLVSTGMKCQLDEGTYLELSVRSSCPLKYWIIMANGVGIIDRDYYNNDANEGEIYFQLINLSPFPIYLKAGDVIGQGIIKPYLTTEDDDANGVRKGGFGSTDNA